MRDPKTKRDLASIDPMLKTYAKDVFGMPDEDLVKLTVDGSNNTSVRVRKL